MSEKSTYRLLDNYHAGTLVVFGVSLIALAVGWGTSVATGDDAVAIGAAIGATVASFLLYSYVTYGR